MALLFKVAKPLPEEPVQIHAQPGADKAGLFYEWTRQLVNQGSEISVRIDR